MSVPVPAFLDDQPGFLSPDYIVQERLREQFRYLRANPTHIKVALASYPDSFVAQVQAIISRADLPVYEGWPLNTEMLPGIGITLEPAAEEELTIGQQIAANGDGTILYGTSMQAAVLCRCYATSQREANALAMIVQWLLVAVLREDLQIAEGLYTQSTALQDVRPETESPLSLKVQLLFMRAVVLNCRYDQTWATTYPKMSDVQGGADSEQ